MYENLKDLFPWIALVVPLVSLAFPIFAACEQAKTRFMKVLSATLLILVSGLEILKFAEQQHYRSVEDSREIIADKILEGNGKGSPWTEEEKEELKKLFGENAERLIDRLRSWRVRDEDLARITGSCEDAAAQAALDALRARSGLREALCGDSIAEFRSFLVTTREGVEDSLAAAKGGIEETARQVQEDWEIAVSKLDGRLVDMTHAVQSANRSVEKLKGSVDGVSTGIQGLKFDLMANQAAPPDGMLVSLRSNLGNVDSSVDSLNSQEERNREYRRCLARRIWPFTRKCSSLLDEDDSAKPPEKDGAVESTRRAASESSGRVASAGSQPPS